MAHGHKTGGRTKGTPNKATTEIKTFLQGVFAEAFVSPVFRVELLLQVTTLAIDSRTLGTLLAYAYGKPAQAIDHTHSGKLTLAQIVSGTLPDDDEADDVA